MTAAAVRFHSLEYKGAINDSKKLTAQQREAIYENIKKHSEFAFVHIDVELIDTINILNAALEAMAQAIQKLPTSSDFALIDGNKVPKNLPMKSQPVVKGDQLSISIAAASIVAKVERDKLMTNLSQTYPNYGWKTNKGYGTREHLEMLKTHGSTPHHRKSFLPLRELEF